MLLIPQGRDFQVAHSSFCSSLGCLPGDPRWDVHDQKSRTLETDIFSRSDIHPRRREWLGSAFVRDPLTVAFCIYAPVSRRSVESRACSGKKFDLKPLRKKRRRANEGEERRGIEKEEKVEGEGGREGEGQQQPVELNTFVPEPDNGLRNSITRTAS